MAVIQAWFVALLTDPWNPMWTAYVGSSVVALLVVVVIGALTALFVVALDLYWEIPKVLAILAGLWVIYLIVAPIILFPNWGGISVFGVS